jgi:hypothetical protein
LRKIPGHPPERVERGRRRTRQDQIPPGQRALVKLRTFEKDPHRTKKAFTYASSAGPISKAYRLPKHDPAV